MTPSFLFMALKHTEREICHFNHLYVYNLVALNVHTLLQGWGGGAAIGTTHTQALPSGETGTPSC